MSNFLFLTSKKRKFLLSLFLVLLPAYIAVAEDVLRLHLTDGSTMTFVLSDIPEITITVDSMEVTLATTTVTFAHNDLCYLDYGNDGKGSVGIGGLTTDSEATPNVYFSNERLRVTGLKSGCSVYLYNTSGQIVDTSKADTNGCVDFSLNRISKGVYIFSDGNKINMKFAKH